MELPRLAEQREQTLKRITKDALFLLRPFFPELCDTERATMAFHKRITTGAWELSRLLRSSPVGYRFEGSHVAGTQTTAHNLNAGDRETSILIDADTGSKIRQSTETIFDQNGNFGRCLCVIFSQNTKGHEIRVGKATLLVKLNKRQPASTVGRLVKKFTG